MKVTAMIIATKVFRITVLPWAATARINIALSADDT